MSNPNRFMNWSGVSFTPDGGSTAILITGVTSVAFDSGGSLQKLSGDGDRYNTVIVNDFNEPTAKIMTNDIGSCRSIGVGTVGVLVATHNNAKYGSGSGSITYTMRSICSKNGFGGKHRAFGDADIEFDGYSTDGQTNPLSSSVAP